LSAIATNTSRCRWVNSPIADDRAAVAGARGEGVGQPFEVEFLVAGWVRAPGVTGHLARHLEDHELVRPGREAAASAELVELVEETDERVIGRLLGEVVQLGPADRLQQAPPPRELVVGDAHEQVVELCDRLIVARVSSPQPLQP
jgi:hypothetical protein